MSCYLVGKTHIDALVSAALAEAWRDIIYPADSLKWTDGLGDRHVVYAENADGLGEMLWAENYKSVLHRYGSVDLSREVLDNYVYEPIGGTPSAVTILNALDGYRYQSCEHPEWGGSDAAAFCEALERRAVQMLPGRDAEPGWAIDGLADYDPEAAALDITERITIGGVTIAYMSHEAEADANSALGASPPYPRRADGEPGRGL